MNTNFEAIKAEILRRAKKANACTEQYARAYKSESIPELMQVIKDNFSWCCRNGVLDVSIIEQYRNDFSTNGISANETVSSGYLLCDNATVEAYGNATVEAYGNVTVRAYGNATVEAYGNVTVEAYGNVTVRAYGNATVEAYGNVTVKACDNATVRAYGNATVRACDNATVEAYGNAYCTSYSILECKLSDNAIYRVRSTNTVYFASDGIKFEKQ